jgi:hypothetical protein
VAGTLRLWQNSICRRKESITYESGIWRISGVECRARLAHNPSMSDSASPREVPRHAVAVIMEKTRVANHWVSERWEAKGVLPDFAGENGAERVIVQNEELTQVIFPGLELRLRRDEAEGYYYNITSPRPKVFVMWREEAGRVRPANVTVSYHEGARWMDSEAHVDGVPLPPEFLPWIAAFVAQHYRPEPGRKVKYASNKDRGRMGH